MNLTVGFLVFPGLQLLDLAGPYEMFAALSDCEIHLFWKTRESVACSTGVRFYPTSTLDEGPPVDVLCIPGGAGINALLLDQEVTDTDKSIIYRQTENSAQAKKPVFSACPLTQALLWTTTWGLCPFFVGD